MAEDLKIDSLDKVKAILQGLIAAIEGEAKPETEPAEDKPEDDQEDTTEKAEFTDAAWNTPESDLDANQFCSVCLIDENSSGEKVKAKCHLPIRSKPGAPINKNALRNAAARLNQTKASAESKAKAKSRLISLMHSAGIETSLEKEANVIDKLIATMHSNFTQQADWMYGDGAFDQETRIVLSNAIGAALDTFNQFIDTNGLGHLRTTDPCPMMKEIDWEATTEELSKSEDEMIAYSIAYPAMPKGWTDTQGDWIDAEEIRKMAHRWMAESGKYDIQHRELNVAKEDAQVVESFIAPVDMDWPLGNETYKRISKGSWIVATKFSPKLWSDVRSGKLNAYSIRGKGRRIPLQNQ